MKFRQLSLLSLAIALYLISGCGGSGYSASGGPPPPSADVLNGQYAFVLSGFDSARNPMALAGSITADGHGNITGGSIDVNDNQVISASSGALAGTYTLDTNFRGIIVLTNAVGSVTQPLAFVFTLKADGTAGTMIGFDNNNFVLSGTMQKQDSTAFSLAKIAGDFAFELDSRAPSQNTLLGRFTLSSSGTTTNVVLDLALAGVGPTGPATGGTVAATFTAAGPNASGRGTVSLTDNANVARSFVYYVVAAGTSLVMEIDPSGGVQTVYSGVASKQTFPLSATMAASVFALTGVDTVAANDITTIGTLTVTGSNMASLLWDTDDAKSSIFSQMTRSAQVVTFDPITGRGTITVTTGFSNGLLDTGVFYLTNSGKGFLLDATAGANNRALAGRLLPQTVSAPFGPAAYSGNMIVHQTGISVNDNGALDSFVSHAVNNNVLTGTVALDFRDLAGVARLNQTGNITGATFAIDTSTGRGTLTFINSSAMPPYTNTNVFYIIGQSQYVLIDETPAPHNGIPIEFADPQ